MSQEDHADGVVAVLHFNLAALRLAYLNSKGEFITRMDSDDIMAPQKLLVMIGSLIQQGKGHLAVGQVTYFSERGISNGYERYEQWLNQLTETGTNYSEIYKECVIPSLFDFFISIFFILNNFFFR